MEMLEVTSETYNSNNFQYSVGCTTFYFIFKKDKDFFYLNELRFSSLFCYITWASYLPPVASHPVVPMLVLQQYQGSPFYLNAFCLSYDEQIPTKNNHNLSSTNFRNQKHAYHVHSKMLKSYKYRLHFLETNLDQTDLYQTRNGNIFNSISLDNILNVLHNTGF